VVVPPLTYLAEHWGCTLGNTILLNFHIGISGLETYKIKVKHDKLSENGYNTNRFNVRKNMDDCARV
jgi:hypothetical protein